MRQNIRRILIYVALFLFPVTLNYFSPYVSVTGAFQGLLVGSVLVFLLMFVTATIFGRAWCGWLCPVAGLSELSTPINGRRPPVRRLRTIRYSIFTIWFAVLIGGFVWAGGIKAIEPLYLTESLISVDEPLKYVTYYVVLFVLFGLTLAIGKRGACHSICWMSPFLVGGTWLGRTLHLPQLGIGANPSACTNCKTCTRQCPMSIDVNAEVKTGHIRSYDCIACGTCIDGCPKDVLSYQWRTRSERG